MDHDQTGVIRQRDTSPHDQSRVFDGRFARGPSALNLHVVYHAVGQREGLGALPSDATLCVSSGETWIEAQVNKNSRTSSKGVQVIIETL